MTTTPRAARPRMPTAMLVRRIHTWLSVFIAPSVLFLAVTGALQVYKLHENHGSYAAPVILQELGAVHKEQVFEADKKHGPPPGAAAKAPKADAEAAPAATDKPAAPAPPKKAKPTPLSQAALKLFFLVVSISLVATTLVGLWMAAVYSRDKKTCAILFAAGVLVPLATFLLG